MHFVLHFKIIAITSLICIVAVNGFSSSSSSGSRRHCPRWTNFQKAQPKSNYCNTFLPSSFATTQLYQSFYPNDNHDDNSNKEPTNDNDDDDPIPTQNFQTFVNQCTIQSFMFLLAQTRDPHTIRWLDQFTQPIFMQPPTTSPEDEQIRRLEQIERETHSEAGSVDRKPPSRLLQYHGLNVLNNILFSSSSWDIYFAKLLKQPEVTIVIEPLLQHGRQFEIDVNPASLCGRMISVREQILREFGRDLEVIANSGGEIFYSYWEKVKEQKEQQQQQQGHDDADKLSSSSRAFERSSRLFLESNPLDEDADMKPSPLRKGNFDLLMLLTTQEAVERVLQYGMGIEGDTSINGSASNAYLQNFYNNRKHSHFQGNQRHGRADDFIEELMLSPPRIEKDVETTTGEPAILNPLRIAEIVLIERDCIAKAWRKEALKYPEEHMGIRRLMLDRLMGKSSIIETTDDFQ